MFPDFHYFPAAETFLGGKKSHLLAPKLFNNTTFSGKKQSLCLQPGAGPANYT